MTHLVAVGGSDAGISAALRARELDPTADVTVVVADAYPNFSICGIPYYVSGEVTHWRNLAHRTTADLEAAGLQLRLDTLATHIDVADNPSERRLHVRTPDGRDGRDGRDDTIRYDALVVGTGAVPVRPSITGLTGPDTLGPGDGVHLLHSMGDTFAVARTLDRLDTGQASAVIVGAGYIGLEMAEALTARALRVTQIEALPEVLPTVDPELTTQSPGRVRPLTPSAPVRAGRLTTTRGNERGLADAELAPLTGQNPIDPYSVSGLSCICCASAWAADRSPSFSTNTRPMTSRELFGVEIRATPCGSVPSQPGPAMR